MAKAKAPAIEVERFVETEKDLNFAEPEEEPGPRGQKLEEEIGAIREERARQRRTRGRQVRRREVTNYHDAERLHNLATGKVPGGFRDSFGRRIKDSAAHFPGLVRPDEIVDWEEAELLPNPEHYATGTNAVIDDVEVEAEAPPPETDL